MSHTPPGWHDDGQGRLRWWDGARWTEHTHDLPGTPPAGEAPEGDPSDGDATAPPATDSDEPGTESPAVLDPASALGLGEPPAAGIPDYHAYEAADTAKPAGYPGAHAGEEPPAKKSRAWVVPVIIGGAFVVLVILAAVLVPRLIGLLTGGAEAGGVEGTTDEERAAAAVVEEYDQAWDGADCDLFERVTTEEFRTFQALEDCDAFVTSAEQFDAAADDYEVTVTQITGSEGAVTVVTEETFMQVIGDDGAELETPIPGSVVYVYTLVDRDGAWLINDLANG